MHLLMHFVSLHCFTLNRKVQKTTDNFCADNPTYGSGDQNGDVFCVWPSFLPPFQGHSRALRPLMFRKDNCCTNRLWDPVESFLRNTCICAIIREANLICLNVGFQFQRANQSKHVFRNLEKTFSKFLVLTFERNWILSHT